VDPILRNVTFVTVGDGQFHRAAVTGLVPTAAHLDALLAQQQGADIGNLVAAPAAAKLQETMKTVVEQNALILKYLGNGNGSGVLSSSFARFRARGFAPAAAEGPAKKSSSSESLRVDRRCSIFYG